MRCEHKECPVTFHVGCLLWFYCDQTLEKLPTDALYCLEHSEYSTEKYVGDLQKETMLINSTKLTPNLLGVDRNEQPFQLYKINNTITYDDSFLSENSSAPLSPYVEITDDEDSTTKSDAE